MIKTEIGFGHAPANTETWERKVGGTVFVFTKTRKKQDLFQYDCRCKSKEGAITTDSHEGFFAETELNRDDAEARAEFREFIAGHSQN
jgi:hypothetical protein